MKVRFRSHGFDSTSEVPEGRFLGGDLARWLLARLTDRGWSGFEVEEDWGWAVVVERDKYRYLFGIYDMDVLEAHQDGALWTVRVFNRRDRSRWFQKLFKYIHPVAHPEVAEEFVAMLTAEQGIKVVDVAPLD